MPVRLSLENRSITLWNRINILGTDTSCHPGWSRSRMQDAAGKILVAVFTSYFTAAAAHCIQVNLQKIVGALLGFLIWIFTRSTLRIELLLENSRPVLLVHSMHEASSQFERITSHYPPVGEMYLLKKTVVLLTTHNLIQFKVSQLASSKGKPVEVAHLTHSSSSRNPSWATDTWHLRVTKRHLYCSNIPKLQVPAVCQRDFRCIQNVLKHHQYLERWCSSSPRLNLGSCHCEYGSFIIFNQSF